MERGCSLLGAGASPVAFPAACPSSLCCPTLLLTHTHTHLPSLSSQPPSRPLLFPPFRPPTHPHPHSSPTAGVEDNGSLTRVAAFPIGIDPDRFTEALETPQVKANIAQLLNRWEGGAGRCGVFPCLERGERGTRGPMLLGEGLVAAVSLGRVAME